MSRPFLFFRSGAAIFLATTLLVACDENGDFVSMQAFEPENSDLQDTRGVNEAKQGESLDVESPDVFSLTEAGLWDGRPSLGGVWVAHPEVDAPERVIIRNSTNDMFVVGALFRRERDIPGPRFQISSDAAEALGMLAGAPATLSVTALRKKEVTPTPETAAPPEVDTIATPGAVTATSLDPASNEAANTQDPAPQGLQLDAKPVQTTAVTPPTATTLSKPFIQIGIFSVEENAERTAQRMKSSGVAPTVKRFERDGKPFWRVLAGPTTTSTDQRQLLAKVKDAGFTDAYAVTD